VWRVADSRQQRRNDGPTVWVLARRVMVDGRWRSGMAAVVARRLVDDRLAPEPGSGTQKGLDDWLVTVGLPMGADGGQGIANRGSGLRSARWAIPPDPCRFSHGHVGATMVAVDLVLTRNQP